MGRASPWVQPSWCRGPRACALGSEGATANPGGLRRTALPWGSEETKPRLGAVCGGHRQAPVNPLAALHMPPTQPCALMGSGMQSPWSPAAGQGLHPCHLCPPGCPQLTLPSRCSWVLPSLSAQSQPPCHHVPDLPFYLSSSDFCGVPRASLPTARCLPCDRAGPTAGPPR